MADKIINESKENKKTNWVPTVISIIVGIIVTFGATWYTVEISRQEVVQGRK